MTTTTHVHDHGFPTAVDGLPACGPSTVVELGDGDTYDLRIAPVVNELGDPCAHARLQRLHPRPDPARTRARR